LPWVKLEKTYLFDGPDGKCTLAISSMVAASSPSIISCSPPAPITFAKAAHSLTIISMLRAKHFDDADLSFAVISRAAIERIEQVKRALGGTFPWVSSYGSDFNFDFGVSFRREDRRIWPLCRSSIQLVECDIAAIDAGLAILPDAI
jgi:predicted dithiol-disulfide oxidoreductase (DUF899 family)